MAAGETVLPLPGTNNDSAPIEKSTSTTARAWKATRESLAGVFIDDQKAILAGNNKNFVVVDNRGTTVKGPISYASMSDERRSGGLFIGRGDFMDMIPATIVTINPRVMPLPPITGIANVIADIAYFAAFLV